MFNEFSVYETFFNKTTYYKCKRYLIRIINQEECLYIVKNKYESY